MGFDQGNILLDSETGKYFAGQTINGKLVFDQDKVKTFRGIYIKLKGCCRVHWTTSHTRTVNNQTQHYSEVHESNEEYFNSKFYLIGGEKGETSLQPGHYEFPFQYTIPPNCPSSFQGSNGFIGYEIKVVVDRAYKIDQTKEITFDVVSPLDLNLDPYCKEPIEMEFDESYCCWCVSAGSVSTVIKVPVAGFIPGQKIPIEMGCNNRSTVEIDVIRFFLEREITFQAEVNPDTRTEKETVAEIKQGPVPANTTRNMNIDLEIPVMDVYNVNSCRFIDIEYVLKVSIETSGCHEDTDGSRRIVIGTVPLVGFQDNVTNPIMDRMPQTTIVPQQTLPGFGITTQPYPSGGFPYPSNTPYPMPAPYPAGPGFINGPGHPQGSPYPPGQQPPVGPYQPPTSSPYPPQHNGAYPPPNTSPYPPATNSPYPPATNSPYPPPATSPYPPPATSPYPPPATSPYPPQYPGNNALHLNQQAPPLPNKDGTNIPLLPSAGAVPMPVIQPAGPFQSASAPEPSTPDDFAKPLPYNPEFLKNEEKK